MTRKLAAERIAARYLQHRAARFPKGLDGEKIAGVDLAVLETFTVGCVDTFVEKGKLDLWRTAILGLCHHDLGVVVLSLDGSAKEYFVRLELLARSVLEAVRDGAKKA